MARTARSAALRPEISGAASHEAAARSAVIKGRFVVAGHLAAARTRSAVIMVRWVITVDRAGERAPGAP